MDERDYIAMNRELNPSLQICSVVRSLPSENAVMCCAFLDWVNLHTHFWKSPHMKLWYDKSEYYGTKGFTTMEVYELYVAQHST